MAVCCVVVRLRQSAESKRVEVLPLRSKGVEDVKRGPSLKRAAARKGIYTEAGGRVLDQRRTEALESQHATGDTSKGAAETRM